MVFFNYSTMQMAAKVVYYGPGLCGKTTNLQWIFDHTSKDSRGEMVSLATETDRTLFFDLLPIDVGSIAGFSTRIQLYTVPGQVFYNTTRKLVLKGVDGVVFVADSQRPMLQANIESFQNLEENLAEMGLSVDTIPVVLQYNKRDLPNIATVEELDQALNRNNWGAVEASALNGDGVLETLKTVSKATLLALKKRLTKGRSESSSSSSGSSSKTRPASPRKPIPAPPPSPMVTPIAAAAATPAAATPAATTPVAARSAMPQPATPPPAAAPPQVAPPQAAPQPAAPPQAAPPVTASQPIAQVQPATPQPAAAQPAAPRKVTSAAEIREELEKDDGHSTGPMPVVPETPAAAPPTNPQPAAEAQTTHFAEETAVTQAGPAPTAKKSRKKKRAGGFDALAELEKLRKESTKGNTKNGKQELNRNFSLTLKRSALSRAQRFSMTLRFEDADHQVVDEVQHLHVDIDKLQALDRMLLRLNIDLDPTS